MESKQCLKPHETTNQLIVEAGPGSYNFFFFVFFGSSKTRKSYKIHHWQDTGTAIKLEETILLHDARIASVAFKTTSSVIGLASVANTLDGF